MEEQHSAEDVPANHGLRNVRDPRLSLWQSAADELALRHSNEPHRPDINEHYPLINNVGRMVKEFEPKPEQGSTERISTLRTSKRLLHCAQATILDTTQDKKTTISVPGCVKGILRILKSSQDDQTESNSSSKPQSRLSRLVQLLGKPFGDCDLRYFLCILVYIKFRMSRWFQLSIRGQLGIPYYRIYDEQNTFVIDDRLPEDGSTKIALVADWGTGQKGARKLLEKLNEKEPHVVIHLGDIYYSGTKYEVINYFYRIWQDVLNIRPCKKWGDKLQDQENGPYTFTMSGNHDMYCGGKPYYKLIDMLGQPASYFCLRNRYWQFVALDTGVNDADPDPLHHHPTRLQDTEVQWLKDRIAQANGRKTVLLSHHQLFSNNDTFGEEEKAVNENLCKQVKDILSEVTVWLWGHEHNLVVYKRYEVADGVNVLGRCIGHGAFPIEAAEDTTPTNPKIPVEDVHLDEDKNRNDPFLQHGYVLMTLQNDTAEACYYEYDAGQDSERMLCKDVWGKEGWEFRNFLQLPPNAQSN